MRRDKIRNKYIQSGLEYSDIGSKEVYKLQELLIDELSNHLNEDDYSKHVMTLSVLRNRDIVYEKGCISKCHFMMDCKTYPKSTTKPFIQWKRREAISFNSDGFIGFAGWADPSNVQPILKAFDNWIHWVCDKNF